MKFLQGQIIVWTLTSCLVYSAEILMLTPLTSQSHKNLFYPMAEILSQRNHNVTLLSTYPPRKSSPNIRDVTFRELVPLSNAMKKIMTISGKNGFTKEIILEYFNVLMNMCTVVFKDGIFQNWIKQNKMFDVVITDGVVNECLFPVGYLVSNSTVIYNTATLFPWIAGASNVPSPYSYVPNYLLPFSPDMTFWQRFMNAFSLEHYDLASKWITFPLVDDLVQKFFPQAMSVEDAMRSASLVFVNADPVTNVARPEISSVINIGGIHCRPPFPLKKEFRAIVDEVGEDGFVIFSLGSIHDGTFISEQMRENFIRAFSRLKQTVIWKYEKNITVPRNIKVVKWLPQQDLLGHPKAKVFITHSGMLSIQEAIYHGVPMIGIPLFVDQPGNSVMAEKLGIMVPLKWQELTENLIYNTIVNVIGNQSMRDAVKMYSRMFKDRSEHPNETAAYWVEYLVRHQTADHFRSKETNKLNVFQYFLIDVFSVMFLFTVILVYLIKFSFKLIKK